MTEFTGQVPNNQVIDELNQMDIFAAFSRSESFGVAVLEASACELPVVVSQVGGLPEVVQHGETGFIHSLDDMDGMVASFVQLVSDQEKRKQMGKKGRSFVKQHYKWQENVSKMQEIYHELVH